MCRCQPMAQGSWLRLTTRRPARLARLSAHPRHLRAPRSAARRAQKPGSWLRSAMPRVMPATSRSSASRLARTAGSSHITNTCARAGGGGTLRAGGQVNKGGHSVLAQQEHLRVGAGSDVQVGGRAEAGRAEASRLEASSAKQGRAEQSRAAQSLVEHRSCPDPCTDRAPLPHRGRCPSQAPPLKPLHPLPQ